MSSLRRVALGLVAVVVAVTGFGPGLAPASLEANDLASTPTPWQAPTADGAPFLPDADRTAPVLERADLLTQLDDLDAAQTVLQRRPGSSGTLRILESQRAAIDRSLVDVESEDLSALTNDFGIDVGVFPVAELRKPFRNDWNEPRSGGRRHRGTDLLAQIGVPLLAIEDGTFEQTTYGSLGGLSVYLLGDSGSRYYYAHLDQAEAFVEGQRVHAGQVIGTVGDSGNAKGSPHLHIQWAPNGDSDWANPYPLLATLYGEGESTPILPVGPTGVQR